MGISTQGEMGNCFILRKNNKSVKNLQYYLDQFNLSDYIILKATNNQRLVTQEDLLNLVNSIYLLFNKKIYNISDIEKWLKWCNSNPIIRILYLTKPFPPIEILDKIKIINEL